LTKWRNGSSSKISVVRGDGGTITKGAAVASTLSPPSEGTAGAGGRGWSDDAGTGRLIGTGASRGASGTADAVVDWGNGAAKEVFIIGIGTVAVTGVETTGVIATGGTIVSEAGEGKGTVATSDLEAIALAAARRRVTTTRAVAVRFEGAGSTGARESASALMWALPGW